MNAWSHLPNAPLIDWVLESVRTDSEKWAAARSAARDAAWDATLAAARAAAWNAAWNVARIAASIWNAAHDVILALIAYDDCDQYLSMSYEQLLAWAHLSEKPQAVLLLPMKWVQEHEALVTSR